MKNSKFNPIKLRNNIEWGFAGVLAYGVMILATMLLFSPLLFIACNIYK